MFFTASSRFASSVGLTKETKSRASRHALSHGFEGLGTIYTLSSCKKPRLIRGVKEATRHPLPCLTEVFQKVFQLSI